MPKSQFRDRIPLEWMVMRTDGPTAPRSKAVPARVPGAAPLDWARASGFADFHFADRWKLFRGLEDQWWIYTTTVPQSLLRRFHGARPVLVLEGVDYACEVLGNGIPLARNEGLHIPIEVPLDRFSAGDLHLEVRVQPAPKFRDSNAWGEEWAKTQRSLAARVTKPSVSYGDDFHPSVIPLGMWMPSYVEFRPACRIARHRLTSRLVVAEDGDHRATVRVRGRISGSVAQAGLVRLTLSDSAGREVASTNGRVSRARFALSIGLTSPELWWPHDHGLPHLYSYTLEIIGEAGTTIDLQRGRFGLRNVRLVMHEGAWEWPPIGRWPKGRSNPPIQVEVNGVRLFSRGACCVPLHVFFGCATADDNRRLVKEAVAANFNMLRISGGCVSYKDEFYSACDELGILVWQDFPLACNCYPDDEKYLALLRREATAMIDKLSVHPSLALWCGGNELFESHSGMTDQSLALRMLDSLTYRKDPQRPFLPSTPLMGFAHGPYEFRVASEEGPLEASEVFKRTTAVAYPEFACPAAASADTLRAIIPSEDLFPPRPGTAWQDHKAFFAFDAQPHTWLNLPMMNDYFGPPEDLDRLVHNSQWMQAHALRAMFEEARRQAPRCSLALMWCLNEPWPNAVGLSLLGWPRERKLAFEAVRDACRPVLASLEIPKFSWNEGETMLLRPWLLSDSPEAVAEGTALIGIGAPGDALRHAVRWRFEAVSAKENRAGGPLAFVVPAVPDGVLEAAIEVEGRSSLNSSYRLSVRS